MYRLYIKFKYPKYTGTFQGTCMVYETFRAFGCINEKCYRICLVSNRRYPESKDGNPKYCAWCGESLTK